MKKFSFILVIFTILLSASSYEKGKEIFNKKCSKCHESFIDIAKLKENFIEKNNSILHLKAPTVNMIHWAITKGPKHIGEKDDGDFRVEEVEEYLKDYLLNPDTNKTICQTPLMKFYDKKKSLSTLSKSDFEPLANYLLFYKAPHKKKIVKKSKGTLKEIDTKAILEKAQKENKLILVEVSSDDCIYCKEMQKDVLDKKDIKDLIDKNYVFVELDVKKYKLPFGIEKVYKNVLPSFFILDKKANGIDILVGYIKKDSFENKLKSYIKVK